MSNEQDKQLTEYAARLNQLQANIQSNATILIEQGKVVLKLAIEAGTVLCQAKDLVTHGEWEQWLSANVAGVSARTAEKYMKLAKQTNHGSEIKADWKTLRQAYLATGIIKQPQPKTPAVQDTTTPTPEPQAQNETQAQDETQTPAESQNLPGLNDVRSLIVQRVRNDIEAAGVNWDVATWAIKNHRPASSDTTNNLAATVSGLKNFILFRQYTSVTPAAELEEKIKAVLNELLNAIIKANTAAQPEPEPNVSDYAFEINPQPVEAAEPVAA